MHSHPITPGSSKVVSLARVGFPRLLFSLLHQRFSGVIELPQSPPHAGPRTVWFCGGMPVFTDWVSPADVLGEVLLEARAITHDQLATAMQTMVSGGGLLGRILIERGAASSESIVDGLAQQCARKLIHVFGVLDADVTVSAKDEALKGYARVGTLEVILAGVGTHYSIERIEAEIGASIYGVVQSTAALDRYVDHFGFRASDEVIVKTLREGTQLERLAGMPGISARRAAQVIYTLWCCRMLRVAGGPADGRGSQRRSVPPAPVAPGPVSHGSRASSTGNYRLVAVAADGERASSRDRRSSASLRPYRSSTAPPSSKRRESILLATLEPLETRIEQGGHAFAILGVAPAATKAEIREAWSHLSRKLHPDALVGKGLDHLRRRVESVFAAVSEAHMILNDQDQREQLRQQVERGEEPTSDADALKTAREAIEGDWIAKEADKLLRAQKFGRALDRYEEALRLVSTDTDLEAAATWCRYNISARRRVDAQEAEHVLAKLLEDEPRNPRGHYFRGLVLKDMGKMEAALLAFGEAHDQNPRLIDAERQARALRMMRAQAVTAKRESRSRRSFFGKR